MLSRKIKKVLYTLSHIALVLGLIFASVTTLASVGYFLYLWGALSLPIGAAAWSAFVFAVKYVLSCTAVTIIAAFRMSYFE